MKSFIVLMIVLLITLFAVKQNSLKRPPETEEVAACWVINNQLTPAEQESLWGYPESIKPHTESDCAVALIMLLRGYRLGEVK